MAQAGGAARRYARAILDLVLANGEDLSAWIAELETIGSELGRSDVSLALDSPRVPPAQKNALIDQLFPNLGPLQANLLHLLVQRRRTALAQNIAREFRRLAFEHQGVAEATVWTAIPIDEAAKAHIAERLGQLTGKRVIVRTEVDPSIVGGLVARIGDQLINGSVSGRLEALREQLVAR